MFWSKLHCDKFTYDGNYRIAKPTSFKDDLDVIIFSQIGNVVAHAISVVTEMGFMFSEKDLKYYKAHGMRFYGGIDYQIYIAPLDSEKPLAEKKKAVAGMREITYPVKPEKEDKVEEPVKKKVSDKEADEDRERSCK